MKILHNSRCRKSRETLEILNQRDQQVEIVEYLINPPSEKELATIIKMLGIKPEQLVRKGESIYKEKFKGKDLSDAEWIKVLASHPKLIERPIVINGDHAVIGRPPQNVLKII